MGVEDREFENVGEEFGGGGSVVEDGNYKVTDGIRPRAMRLLRMQRGKWAGGRGRKIGSRLHTLKNAKDTPELRAEVPRMIKEAWQPLLDEGVMQGLQTVVREPAKAGFLFFDSEYFDTTKQQRDRVRTPAPWQ